MFDRVCVRASNFMSTDDVFDLGALAEALIFYGTTHVILNHVGFKDLVRTLGPEILLRMAQTESIQISYCNQMPAVRTLNTGSTSEKHDFVVVQSPQTTIDAIVHDVFQDSLGEGSRTRRRARQFLNAVQRLELDESLPRIAELDSQDPRL